MSDLHDASDFVFIIYMSLLSDPNLYAKLENNRKVRDM
jgi:hypothetical protein